MLYFADLDNIKDINVLIKLKTTDNLVLFYSKDSTISMDLHAALCKIQTKVEYIPIENDYEKSYYVGAYLGIKPIKFELLSEIVIPKGLMPEGASKKRSASNRGRKPKQSTVDVKINQKEIVKKPNISKPSKRQKESTLKETLKSINNKDEFIKKMNIDGTKLHPIMNDSNMIAEFLIDALALWNEKETNVLNELIKDSFFCEDEDSTYILKSIKPNLKELTKMAKQFKEV